MESHESTAVVLVDPNGIIVYWSHGAASLFGHRDALGKTLDLIVPEDFRERHWGGFRRAMATGDSPISGSRLNIPIRCDDGAVRTFPGTFSVQRDAHGRPVGAIGIWSSRRGDEEPFTPVAPLEP